MRNAHRDEQHATEAPQIQVLLATYNGEAYLQEQIHSILSQKGVRAELLISDDGSTDSTVAMLEQYRSTHPETIRLLPSLPNSGHPKWNFLRLLAASDAPYIALADQDDIWLPGKLQSSMAAMQALTRTNGSTTPLLVFTDMKVVQHDLSPVAGSFWANQQIDPERIHSLRHLLVQNVVAGCTTLLNRTLVLECLTMPAEAAMHDWWIALIACTLGRATVLHEPTVLYRQHQANAVGAVLDHRRRLLPRPRFHTRRRAQWELAAHQGAAFLQQFGFRLQPGQRQLLEQFVQCERSQSRVRRLYNYLRYGFFQKGVRPNLAIAWYLWDMKAAKRQDESQYGS